MGVSKIKRMKMMNDLNKMFTDAEREQIRQFGKLVVTSPFSAERTAVEDKLLGRRTTRSYHVWYSVNGDLSVNRNLKEIDQRCEDC